MLNTLFKKYVPLNIAVIELGRVTYKNKETNVIITLGINQKYEYYFYKLLILLKQNGFYLYGNFVGLFGKAWEQKDQVPEIPNTFNVYTSENNSVEVLYGISRLYEFSNDKNTIVNTVTKHQYTNICCRRKDLNKILTKIRNKKSKYFSHKIHKAIDSFLARIKCKIKNKKSL